MTIIYACHEIGGQQFCFSVPDSMAWYISKGTILYVDTMRGPRLAYATTGTISGPGAEDIAKASGAYFPLREVISFVPAEAREQIAADATLDLRKRVRDVIADDLPF